MLYGGYDTPQGTFLVIGQTLSISSYSALYALLGTNYGGDGKATFLAPNLQASLPIGIGQGQMSFWSVGQQTGVEDIYMTEAQMPAHQHTVPSLGIATGFTGRTPAPEPHAAVAGLSISHFDEWTGPVHFRQGDEQNGRRN